MGNGWVGRRGGKVRSQGGIVEGDLRDWLLTGRISVFEFRIWSSYSRGFASPTKSLLVIIIRRLWFLPVGNSSVGCLNMNIFDM